jgi:hypothetical protein
MGTRTRNRMSTRSSKHAIVCLLLAASLTAGTAHSQAPKMIPPPARSDAGDWTGTWYYVNRDSRFVFWIQLEQGLPQVKVRYLSLSNLEGFETDWQGQAQYDHQGSPVTFSLDLVERDANTIKGKWSWELLRANGVRRETADVTMYRALDGRQLAVVFENYKRIVVAGDERLEVANDFSWSFRKASSRMVRWDELPF